MAHYQYSRDEFMNMTLPDLSPPEDVPALLEELRARSSTPSYRPVTARRHVRKDGTVILVEITGQRHLFDGRPAALALLQDVTEKLALQEKLQEQAFHDPLTGLANRALFADRLDHALASRRPGDPPTAAVVLVDLDNFKTINDTRGHATGDQLLEQVARRLESTARPGDTVARMGGDEFMVLLPNAGNLENGEAVAKRISASLRDPVDIDGDKWFISASIGVALDGKDRISGDDLMAHADVAMYSSKHGGRDRVCVYRSEVFAETSTRSMNIRELSESIDNGQLRVHYQPQVDARSGRMTGVEALVRWQHPERGLLPPGEFIPMAEETGLITAIDLWVAAESIRQLKSWDEHGMPELRLSLNVSAGELLQRSFVDRLSAIIQARDMDPRRIEVEVTETVAVESAGATEALMRLKEIGITVAIDDFGIGHSMVARLKDFPVDRLKIDRSFIQQMTTPRGEALVAGMISMGHSLNLTLIAEGVEHDVEFDQLASLGCDQVQGFLISPALESSELGRLLESSEVLTGRPIQAAVSCAVA